MLLLAIDTSQDAGSVSLAEASGEGLSILETAGVEGGAFSAQLVPRIASLLQKRGQPLERVAAFIAATGPGSFTGLRIGLAAAKGLAEVMDRPIIAVSMLEVLASLAPPAAKDIVSIMDARRGQYYVGEYQREGDRLECVSERLCAFAEVVAMAGMRVCADHKVAAGLHAAIVDQPTSAEVARAGFSKFRRNETTTVEQLDANYLRRDDNLFFKA